MAKQILKIESTKRVLTASRCMYPTPRLFISTLDKMTGVRTAFEQSAYDIPQPNIFMQKAMTDDDCQTEKIVWDHLCNLTKNTALNRKSPNNPNIPKNDRFDKAKKKRTVQRWAA